MVSRRIRRVFLRGAHPDLTKLFPGHGFGPEVGPGVASDLDLGKLFPGHGFGPEIGPGVASDLDPGRSPDRTGP